MKKFISILFLFAFTIVFATAQSVTLPTMEAYAKVGTYQQVTTDYTLTNTTARTFIYTAPQPEPTTQDYVVKLDSLTGTGTGTTKVDVQELKLFKE